MGTCLIQEESLSPELIKSSTSKAASAAFLSPFEKLLLLGYQPK
ncbi:hypothetical protein [Pseudoalteromonas marina]|uniref:Uncharacterized protein n=1 Tax=Pseudoalteromonas marina TaxID=267375 RepID=A0ABT9FIM0_9GAMM|nr:hypothetical protein [Pseudoalteromonas marina]MDP2566450.1 hypothetical protein [Pseudoalteromonas marina]